jgi:regulator of RNase E activity RraB
MHKVMDTESNSQIIEIELNEGISNIDNLNEFIQQIIGSITRNISYYTNGANSSTFTIEYEIINNESEEQSDNKKILCKDITNQLGSYKRIKIDDDLIKCKSSCPVCLENYKDSEYKRELKCNHVFHKKCIDKWIKVQNNCPICRHTCITI